MLPYGGVSTNSRGPRPTGENYGIRSRSCKEGVEGLQGGCVVTCTKGKVVAS